MRRQDALEQIVTKDTDFVVDVGGGHRPFWRANLVVEKHPFENSLHRNRPMQFPNVPVIKADALSLPIPDQGCDLIFASHIIEHLPDPAGFVRELKRCSKRVYLEFPSRAREVLFAWSFHEWLVEADGPALRFYRNDLPQMFGALFHTEWDATLGAWSEVRHEHLNTSIYCRTDELSCEFPTMGATERVLSDSPQGAAKVNFATEIHRPVYSLRECAAVLAQSLLPSALYAALTKSKEAASQNKDLTPGIVNRLMCLQCRTPNLSKANSEIVCSCGARYGEDRGVYDFDVVPSLPAR